MLKLMLTVDVDFDLNASSSKRGAHEKGVYEKAHTALYGSSTSMKSTLEPEDIQDIASAVSDWRLDPFRYWGEG